MRRSALAVAVTALFLPTVAASIADAEPMTPDNWTAPTGLGVAGHVNLYPELSMGAGGDVTAAVNDLTAHRLVVQTHPAGGVWSTPAALSTDGNEIGEYRVATSPADDAAVAIWGESLPDSSSGGMGMPGPPRAYVASRVADGGWGAPVALSPDGVYALALSVTLAADGRAVALWWERYDGLHASIRSAGGTWGPSALVASTGSDYVSETHLVLRPDGSAVAVWQQEGNLMSSVLRSATWSSPTGLGRGGGASLASDGRGDVAFSYINAPTTGKFVRSIDRDDDTWTAPVKLSNDGALNYYEGQLSIAPDGSAVAAWPQADTGSAGNRTYVARRDADGTWHAAELVGKSTSDTGVAAAGVNGMSAIGYQSSDSGSPFKAALATPFSAFASASAISGGGPGSDVVMGGDGRGSAAAAYQDGVDSVSRVTFQDRSGPDLRKVKVPDHATAGRAVSTFSVRPVDAFNDVALTAWDFGDGSGPVTGEHPSHTYAEPGTYTVGVSAKDTLGWSTTKLYTITVGAAQDETGTEDPGDDAAGEPDQQTPTPAPAPAPPAPAPAPPAADQAKAPAPALTAPTVMLAHRQKLATILSRKAIRTTVAAPAAGTVKVTATVSRAAAKRLGLKSTRLAVTTTKVKAKSNAKVSLPLSAAVRARASKLKSLTVTLTVVFTSADGHTTTTRTTLSTRA